MLTRFEKSVAIAILIVSIYIALTGGMLFPFSSYPLFKYVRKDSTINAIVVHYTDGRKVFAKPRVFAPVTRLNVSQMIDSTLRNRNDAPENHDWVKFFFKERILKEPNVDYITLERVDLGFPFAGEDLSKTNSKVLLKMTREEVE